MIRGLEPLLLAWTVAAIVWPPRQRGVYRVAEALAQRIRMLDTAGTKSACTMSNIESEPPGSISQSVDQRPNRVRWSLEARS